MRRDLYEFFEHIGVPYTLNEEITKEDRAAMFTGGYNGVANVYASVRIGTARIMIATCAAGDRLDEIAGVLNDDGTFVLGRPGAGN